ncbi:ATP-binding protein [Streptomyces sp. MJP52]|uniref:ATP-binding protein n=1 Tax=Streptomyces sp. MJP52 TaxID=2940555 RepID=UPI002473363F|nr:ATP-binding protein [Streptomyces sp. MJP52]MDH6228163.1 anti-sigma regulatory factor (Ser/Thr protein kinase) [Streptomyces sp. MJP52]
MTEIPEAGAPDHRTSLRFSRSKRGARLARQLAVQQFTEWTGLPHSSDSAQAVALVVAELAANAVTHGSLPSRDFRLTLTLKEGEALRVEVTDTRPERLPQAPDFQLCPGDAVTGRGLMLVEAYAERWGCQVVGAFTKTVWAEVRIPRERTEKPAMSCADEWAAP